MKLSDYIVDYLYKIGIKDYFGYQGTMIAHFIDSIGKNKNVTNHVCYNEQGAAFAAVGYAKVSGRMGCAYATSGPGAINLMTGIADAYYDSVPVIFITGQLNTYEYTNSDKIRQQGFQESDIVNMVKPVVKYAIKITNPYDIAYELEKAVYIATNDRKGPVLIDIPMDIQRANIDINELLHYEITKENKVDYDKIARNILNEISQSNRPLFLLGNGIDKNNGKILELINGVKIPVIYSMLAKSLLPDNNKYNFGFMGSAYGQRYANIIGCEKADLIVSLGCRMNGRTIGVKRNEFNKNAKIIRVDIDDEELKLKIHSNDEDYNCDVNILINTLCKMLNKYKITDKSDWLNVCTIIKKKLENIDKNIPESLPNQYIEVINDYIDENTNIFVDVGQNQVWAAHSFKIKEKQKIIFSGGLGAMGFALPAAIGGAIATKSRTIVIAGDGGLQMNIQELQTLKRESLPITIFVFNNDSLGLIHQQQCDFFDHKFYGACEEGGYEAPDFCKIAEAYGIKSRKIKNVEELKNILNDYNFGQAGLLEIKLPVGTKAYPKTFFGHKMTNQRPELPDEFLEKIKKL